MEKSDWLEEITLARIWPSGRNEKNEIEKSNEKWTKNKKIELEKWGIKNLK